MRELKREEYGMISGGYDQSTVFVNGPPNGVYIPSAGTGTGPRGMGEADSGMGGGRANTKNSSIQCGPGTNPVTVSVTTKIQVPVKIFGQTIQANVISTVKAQVCRQ